MMALAALLLFAGVDVIPVVTEARPDYVAAARDKPQIEPRPFEKDKPFFRTAGPQPLENADDLRDHSDAKRVVSSRCAARGPDQTPETKGTSPMDYNCGEVGK